MAKPPLKGSGIKQTPPLLPLLPRRLRQRQQCRLLLLKHCPRCEQQQALQQRQAGHQDQQQKLLQALLLPAALRRLLVLLLLLNRW